MGRRGVFDTVIDGWWPTPNGWQMERQQPLEAVRDFLGPDTDFEIDRGIAGWMRPTATPGDGIEAGVGARAARSPWRR